MLPSPRGAGVEGPAEALGGGAQLGLGVGAGGAGLVDQLEEAHGEVVLVGRRSERHGTPWLSAFFWTLAA